MTASLLLLGLCACTTPDSGKDTGDDSVPVKDTEIVDDSDTGETADTADTGDSTDTAETGETGETGDTGDTDTGTPPELLALRVSPAAITVEVGATLQLRVTATLPTGEIVDDASATFGVDDAAVATVDAAGLVTALAAGATTVHATDDGLDATLALTVSDAGTLTVTVLDAWTDLPIEDATVSIPDGAYARTDSSGVAVVSVADPAPLTFSAYATADWSATTFVNSVSRDLTVRLMPKDTGGADATIHGIVDDSGIPAPDATEVMLGLACASVQGPLASLRMEDLFAPARTFTFYGLDVSAPANIYIGGYVDDFEAQSEAGPVALWSMAGDMAIADLTSGIADTSEALDLFVHYLPSMVWDSTTGIAATSDATVESAVAPASGLSDVLSVALPALPDGFFGTEDYFVVTAEERADEGWVLTGLGTGTTTADVQRVPPGSVPDALGSGAWVMTQVGGLGSGGATSTAVAAEVGGVVAMPELLDAPSIDTWDPASRAVAWTVDGDADLVRLHIEDHRHQVHDVYVAGAWSGTEPNVFPELSRVKATLELTTIDTAEGSFEEWVTTGDVDPDGIDARAVARVTK